MDLRIDVLSFFYSSIHYSVDCVHIFPCIGNYGTVNTIPISFINWCSSTAAKKLRMVKQFNVEWDFFCTVHRGCI